MTEPTPSPTPDAAEPTTTDNARVDPDAGRGVRLWFLYPFELYTLVLVGGTVLFLRW